MFNWLLKYLEKKGRKSIIMDRAGIAPYLERWYLIYPDGDQRKNQDIPFNAFIHRFMQSDDPVIHSHPWNWSFSIILRGGYWEHLPGKVIWRRPGSFRLMRPGKDLHWVEVPEPGKTWTLFVRGRTINNHWWGFMPDEKTGDLVYYEDYLAQHKKVK